jgi:phosphoribosyl 1,2-cyclic phosphate phosphodiesterase
MGELIILGCGGSAGVPAIGNWWGNCDPQEPRNRRTRPSIALKTETTLVIVDSGPDFREQINREKLGCPDAIIITHEHSDHVNGLDECRVLQRLHKRKFDVYATETTMKRLASRLDYMFIETEDGFYPAVCSAVKVVPDADITIGDIVLTPFEQDHGTIKSLGLRIGNIGYSTDVKKLEATPIETLTGIDTWIVDGGGHYEPKNPVHASIHEVIEMNKKIGAKKVILTHLPPTMDYQTLSHELPKGFEPAYDGMTLEFAT